MAVADASRRYDHQHRTLRALWAKRIARGEFIECARCGDPIVASWPPPPGVWPPARHVKDCNGKGAKGRKCAGECWARWELGHIDGGGPRDWSGPEHFSCNRRAGGINGARAAHAVARETKRIRRAERETRPHVSRQP